MTLTHATPPSRQELRSFGWVMAVFICLVFGLLLPWLWSYGLPRWPWALAAVLVTTATVWPLALRPVHRGWMAVGGVLGRINTTVLLFLVYYLVFTPLGSFLRLIGKDTLAKTWRDQRISTYRKAASQRPGSHMERQF